MVRSGFRLPAPCEDRAQLNLLAAFRSLSTVSPSNDISEHVTRISLQRSNDPQHFEHVDAPLAALIVRHE